jgi:hypothetical protein
MELMFTRGYFAAAVVLFLVTSASARPPKRIYYEATLDTNVEFEPENSPRPQPALISAAQPAITARELACEPLVIRAFVMAWKSTLNGTRNHGLGESGFAIESYMSTLSVQGWREALMNELFIPADHDTIAVAHVHGRGADEHPAKMDVQSRVPNFVISRDALYVTVPGSSGFIRLRGGVNDHDGWNKPCASPSLVAQQ